MTPLLALLLLLIPAPFSATAAPALPDPVAHWAFDEATGSSLLDSSGNGRDGSFSGQITRIDDGVYDRALRLHSSSTTATAEAAGFDAISLTVSIWVRSDEVPTSGAVLFAKGARDCDGPTFGIRVIDTGLEVNLMAGSGVVGRATLPGDLGLWDGDWHHISFTHSWMDHLRIYVDGAIWGMGHGGLVLNYTDVTAQDFAFGSSVAGAECDVPAYVGDLDDIRIYDRVLDQSQLGSLEPPIPTATRVTPRPDAQANVSRCHMVTVDPPPGAGGELHMSELLTDGREVDIGIASNEWCVQMAGDPQPPPGTYLVRLSFDTKGTHRIRARFVPGDPWQASTSPWVDQVVAGVPTTTYIEVDPVDAWESIQVRAAVLGSTTYMTGSIALYDITGTPTHIETKAIPFTGAVSGSVTFQLVGRPAGTYRLEARYLGDSDVFEPSLAETDLTVTGSGGADTVAPTVSAPMHRFVTGTAISSGRTTVRLGWTGSDAGSGIDHYELVQQTDGGTWTSVSTALTSASLDRALAHGHSYRFRVRAIDAAGNASAWLSGPTFRITHYGETSSRIRYSGSWAITKSTAFWGGQARASSSAGARATISVTGRSVEWVARKGPTRGKAQVYVNGVLKATVDLYASTYQNQRVVWSTSWSTSATRTVSIRVLGTSGRPRVELDAIVVGS